MGPVRHDYDAGKSITRAIVRALNISTFLGPEIASSRQASAISGPKKVEIKNKYIDKWKRLKFSLCVKFY